MRLELIDDKFRIDFEHSIYVSDFDIISKLVEWCDSYTRGSILIFHFLKDCTNYMVCFERDKQLPEYIKSILVYIRKPKHRLEWENRKIQEFKDFIFKSFKKAKPKVNEWIINSQNIPKENK